MYHLQAVRALYEDYDGASIPHGWDEMHQRICKNSFHAKGAKHMKTNWYLFSQNNSGGSFIVDDDVSEYVFIQANTGKEAEIKALEIGIYFNGVEDGSDCECCGDRWYGGSECNFPMSWGTEKLRTINDYIKTLSSSRYNSSSKSFRVYYADGKIERK